MTKKALIKMRLDTVEERMDMLEAAFARLEKTQPHNTNKQDKPSKTCAELRHEWLHGRAKA